MMKRRDVGMPLPGKGNLVVLAEPETFQKAEGIAVPARNIEIACDVMVIELGVEPHEIVNDITPGRGMTDDRDLRGVEGDDLVR